MKAPQVVPNDNLLTSFDGIESTLLRGKRIGHVGVIGMVLAAAQFAALLARARAGLDLSQLSDQLPVLLLGFSSALSWLFINWNRFWVKQSEAPFRYTCYLDAFTPADGSPSNDTLRWLRRDLTERLSQRVGRLAFLDDRHAGENHIYVGGEYVIRRERPTRPTAPGAPRASDSEGAQGRLVLEVMPRVRVGPATRPAVLAHSVCVDLKDGLLLAGPPPAEADPTATPAAAAPARSRARKPASAASRLERALYDQLLERVYFSIASQIYKQIRQDVQRKIDLLPTSSFRAAAYFYEAEDYARSNTLDAYDAAAKLYRNTIELLDPQRVPLSSHRSRRLLQRLRRLRVGLLRCARRALVRCWPGLGKSEVMLARAQLGYANMLLDRRLLAGLSGRRINPVFEARPVAQDAVDVLQALPRDVPERNDALFAAYVTLALAWTILGSPQEAARMLERARQLAPSRIDQDARYLFGLAAIEPEVAKAKSLLQRAVEVDPEFEVAQFQSAVKAQMQWRARPEFERNVADLVLREYDTVLGLNPGNVMACANVGYMLWLLDEPSAARDYLERGRVYKGITRETFVVDIDLGLARLAAERGDLKNAYEYYTSAAAAYLAQASSHQLRTLSSFSSDEVITASILKRFGLYRERVERELDKAVVPVGVDGFEPEASAPQTQRILDSVRSFVLRECGQAHFNYFAYSGDRGALNQARELLERSKRLDPENVLAYYDLAVCEAHEAALARRAGEPTALEHISRAVEHIDYVTRTPGDWCEGKFLSIQIDVIHGQLAREEAARLEQLRHEKSAAAEAAEAQARSQEQERPEPADPQSVGNSHEPYRTPNPAKRQAEELRRQVNELQAQLPKLRDKAQQAFARATKAPTDLVPHEWLWRGQELDAAALLDRRFEEERTWEREFDDTHVEALVVWSKAVIQTALARQSQSQGAAAGVGAATPDNQAQVERLRQTRRLLRHIRQHFWQDHYDVLWMCRELRTDQGLLALQTDPEEGADPGDERLRRVIARRMEEAPDEYLTVRDTLHDLILLGASEQALSLCTRSALGSSPDLLLSVGQQLEHIAQRLPNGAASEEERQRRERAWQASLRAYAGALEAGARADRGARFQQENACRLGKARVLWAQGKPSQALAELRWVAVDGQANNSNGNEPASWPADFVHHVVDQGQLSSGKECQLLMAWLDGRLRSQKGARPASLPRAGSEAQLRLFRQRYAPDGPAGDSWRVRVHDGPKPPFRETVIALATHAVFFPGGKDTPVVERLTQSSLPAMRERIERDTRVQVPGVRIRIDPTLRPDEYVLYLHELPLGRGRVTLGERFCPDRASCERAQLAGRRQPRPDGPGDGLWLDAPSAVWASSAELETWDAYEFMVRHLEATLRRHLPLVLDVQETENILSRWEQAVDDVEGRKTRRAQRQANVPDVNALVCLTQLLQRLCQERVPVRDIGTLLEVFATADRADVQLLELVEQVRLAIRDDLPGNAREYVLIGLEPELEAALDARLRPTEEGPALALPMAEVEALRAAVAAHLGGPPTRPTALVVERPRLRPLLWNALEPGLPYLAVIAERELQGWSWHPTRIACPALAQPTEVAAHP